MGKGTGTGRGKGKGDGKRDGKEKVVKWERSGKETGEEVNGKGSCRLTDARDYFSGA